MEGRLLLSTIPPVDNRHPYLRPLGVPAVRPNTPVLPFGATKVASFIDPTVGIVNGRHVIVGNKTFIGPYAKLNSTSGFIKIGTGSSILDGATIQSNPTRAKNPTTSILIGNFVSVGFGATVIGPSQIGAFGAQSKPTGIGANALIDSATIEPGAIVGTLARVGPGVTVPAGIYVLPGANVTTNAEASDPALGKVAPITATEASDLSKNLANNTALAAGYAALFQGDSSTGTTNIFTPARKGVFNGNLSAVEGAGNEPGSANGPSFEPTSPTGPTFQAPLGQQQPGLISNFRARVTGEVVFHQQAAIVAHSLGIGNSIRADQGQPFVFGSTFTSGDYVVINSPLGSNVASTGSGITIYDGVQAGDRSVILGGPGAKVSIGGNVIIGAGAVLDRSTIGAGASIGARAYVANSTIADGTVVPTGAIIINNKLVGSIQW
ncbi:Carbonic anhydrase or acetyltransferase, isoleucine patch superfamily [Singulisphaera sp. GP187]|uniref:carbonic anhydrase/acetyltransferase n=1 Tax=Singulisphaera sp. GP187 TaxID=1882752 RepID=UPI00092A436C|nr:carbonic anhydrase/acetyltransferase [Singulisphaera sp. GP187]SIO40577.1 Carbonic anhydrase or acetyltransferase, isoleucine patch superfamily [Singulisphaera sp. GP187]